ncbi:site-specific DNA-methyltransferase [Sandaracinobacteroides hominis]|uniref:site-specific DNA-methyltransferase n=1 Tax=Sandaracinobacteroides hominis TaxID=2780086 RepID=UPI0018F2E878|nr:site-specific DNA-methyltransferase [Sandaracinobacteroides hominis]
MSRLQNSSPGNQASQRQKEKRLAAGLLQKAEEANSWPGYTPTRTQILIPLLSSIASAGVQNPAKAAEAVADLLGIPDNIRSATKSFNGRPSNLWHRTVRWAMQDARRLGWLTSEQRGKWTLTDPGNEALGRIKHGICVTIFRTSLGKAIAAVAQSASTIIEHGTVQAIFTSPLFPLTSENMKSYGTMRPAEWIPWMLEMLASWLPVVQDDGIIALHLGATHYQGMPAISNYRERFILSAQDDLGLFRMPDLFWENPSRLPNLQWGAVRGMTPRPTVDPIYLLSKTPFPYMNAGACRDDRPSQPEQARRGKEARASGLIFGPGSFAGQKTTFPSALIRAGGSSGAETWRKNLAAAGLTAHPCPMPVAIPKFVIEMTTRPNDLVFDPFLGSGSTAAAAQQLGRRWIGTDHHRQYLHGAACRPEFQHAAGFEVLP